MTDTSVERVPEQFGQDAPKRLSLKHRTHLDADQVRELSDSDLVSLTIALAAKYRDDLEQALRFTRDELRRGA